MKNNKYLSTRLYNKLPLFISELYPKFAKFLYDYFVWVDEGGSSHDFITNFLSYHDVDETEIKFVDYFAKTFMVDFPIEFTVDKRTLIKHIKEYYRSKGSEKSIKFLFKILFNDDVEIYYPYYDILIPSDGKWIVSKYIKTTDLNDIDISQLTGSVIEGQTSGAKGIVESITKHISSQGYPYLDIQMKEFTAIHNVSLFEPYENVQVSTWDNSLLLSEFIVPICVDIEVEDTGKYYLKNDFIKIETLGQLVNDGSFGGEDVTFGGEPVSFGSIPGGEYSGVDAFALVDRTSVGVVDSINIVSAGTGYTINDIIEITTDGRGHGAHAIISAVGSSGEITELRLINTGIGYTSLPIANIVTGSGTDAVLVAESTSIGNVLSVTMFDTGVGYIPMPEYAYPSKMDNSTITFLTTAILYNLSGLFQTGESVTSTSGGVGTLSRIDTYNNIAAILVESGTFAAGDTITGSTSTVTATIYNSDVAIGTAISDGNSEVAGYFKNTDGQISSDKYLQDSYYYQKFSYVISTNKERKEWFDLVNETVHPAGTIVFGFSDISQFPMIEDSYGGFVAPHLESIGISKFRDMSTDDYAITSISLYKDFPIEEFSDETYLQTTYCSGTEFTISTPILEMIDTLEMTEDLTME